MEAFNRIVIDLYLLIQEYPIHYFSIIGLSLIVMIYILMKNRYSKKGIIKRIRYLLSKDMDKALNEIIASDLDIIDYFLNQENLDSNEYVKIKEYLLESEQLKKIYNKIINYNGTLRDKQIKTGISILSRLPVPPAIDYLITFLYEDNQEIINLVIEKLSNYQTDKVIYSLIEFAKYTTNSNILSNLKKVFIKMGPEIATKLTPLIYEADPVTKIWYIDIIGEYQNEEFYQLLLNLLNIDNPEMKIHVIQKLSNYELKDEIINKLIELLEDENWGVRSQAIKILGNLRIEKAAPFLGKKLTDKSGVVRASATDALLNLGYKGIEHIFEVAKNPEAPDEIKEILKEQDISFLIEALEHIYQNDKEKIHAINSKLTS